MLLNFPPDLVVMLGCCTLLLLSTIWFIYQWRKWKQARPNSKFNISLMELIATVIGLAPLAAWTADQLQRTFANPELRFPIFLLIIGSLTVITGMLNGKLFNQRRNVDIPPSPMKAAGFVLLGAFMGLVAPFLSLVCAIEVWRFVR